LFYNSTTIVIDNSQIHNNISRWGGGIYITQNFDQDLLVISSTVIEKNIATYEGGGISCRNWNQDAIPEIHLSSSIIRNNTAHTGGGIFQNGKLLLTFDSENRSSIYANYASSCSDIKLLLNNDFTTEIILDRFTRLSPTEDEICNIEQSTVDILEEAVPFRDYDLYVDPINGDDANDGSSISSAMKTIGFANLSTASDSLNPRIINLNEGTYSIATNGELFPIYLSDFISLIGTENEEIIFEGNLENIDYYLTQSLLNDIIDADHSGDHSLNNIILKNGDNAIYSIESNFSMEKIILSENNTYSYGCIYFKGGHHNLTNLKIF